jgi:hypothetical protein
LSDDNIQVDHGIAGFVGEMRAIAMKLHTKEQAPKEGKQPAPKPMMPVISGWNFSFSQ